MSISDAEFKQILGCFIFCQSAQVGKILECASRQNIGEKTAFEKVESTLSFLTADARRLDFNSLKVRCVAGFPGVSAIINSP